MDQQQQQYQYQPAPKPLHPVAAGVIVYALNWVGLIVVAIAGDTQNPYIRFHLNQGLILFLFGLISIPLTVLSAIPFIGILFGIAIFGWGIFMTVLGIIALIGACKGEMKPVPLLGQLKILR